LNISAEQINKKVYNDINDLVNPEFSKLINSSENFKLNMYLIYYLYKFQRIENEKFFSTITERTEDLEPIWKKLNKSIMDISTGKITELIKIQYANIDPITCPIEIFKWLIHHGFYPTRKIKDLVMISDSQRIDILLLKVFSDPTNMSKYLDSILREYGYHLPFSLKMFKFLTHVYKKGDYYLIENLSNKGFNKKYFDKEYYPDLSESDINILNNKSFDIKKYSLIYYNIIGDNQINNILNDKYDRIMYITDEIIENIYLSENQEMIKLFYSKKLIPVDYIKNYQKYKSSYPILDKMGYNFPDLFLNIQFLEDEDLNFIPLTISKSDFSKLLQNYPKDSIQARKIICKLFIEGNLPLINDTYQAFIFDYSILFPENNIDPQFLEKVWNNLLNNGLKIDKRILDKVKSYLFSVRKYIGKTYIEQLEKAILFIQSHY
jgi:hypothetical protein